MAFFFYVPNLVVGELFIRARRRARGVVASFGAATVLLAASAFIVSVTWSFTARSWGPRMISGITEASL
ncbi:hypothetical protein NKY66_30130 [Sinorhizobium meliloti]|jgi:hypothetical protein|uniref:hypothetical protein n=1 Tax=Rhizobium meliloti TaxID=382 RepID=UPI0002E3ADD7|nr:hypothetical protein [Sinorhizobium meliloti]